MVFGEIVMGHEGGPILRWLDFILETKFESELQIARWGGAARLPELRLVQADVVTNHEVRMVEDVESFCAELKTHPFGNHNRLEQ